MTKLAIIRRLDIERSERAHQAVERAIRKDWSFKTIAQRAKACMDRACTSEAYRRLECLFVVADTFGPWRLS